MLRLGPSIIVHKSCTHVVDSMIRTKKTSRGAVGTSTRADARALRSILNESESLETCAWEIPKHVFACHCLGAWEVWDLWSGHGHAKFVESFSTHGHSAELAGATTNSDGKRRTDGYRRRYDVALEQTVAVGGCTDTPLRLRIAQTATVDVIDPTKAQPIREPCQFRLRR